MKFYIKHSVTGRLRVHMDMKHMSFKQADILAVSYTHLTLPTKA